MAMNSETIHPDEATIHDLVDDELGDADRAAVEKHLAECAPCRALTDSFFTLRKDARRALGGVGTVGEPDHKSDGRSDRWSDQWRAIEARLDARPPLRRPRWRPAPLAAAAAVLLLASSVVFYALSMGDRGRETEPGVDVAATGTPVAPGAAITVAYAPAVTELERLLAEERDRLRPETVAVLEANLEILNAAIREIETALEADPMHRGSLRSLDGMYQAKLDVLRQAVGLSSGA
jgi:anti-sigma factor RsiW